MLKVYLGNDNLQIRQEMLPTTTAPYLDDATISLAKNSKDNAIKASFTDKILFYGDDASYIFQVLVTHSQARKNYIYISIKEDCCGELQLFYGRIKSDLISWTDYKDGVSYCECSVEITAEEASDVSQQFNCIRNKFVYEPCRDEQGNPVPCPNSQYTPNFQEYKHPFSRYCNSIRPKGQAYLNILLSGITGGTIALLTPILAIIGIIVFVISFLLTDEQKENMRIDDNPFAWVEDMWDWLKQYTLGCSEGHITPYVRDLVNNACQQCGLSFSSSILNDTNSDYYNTVLFAPISVTGYISGSDPNSPELGYSDDYRINYWSSFPADYTGEKFLNMLNSTFNAKWWIENNVLHFESIDISNEPLLDLSDGSLVIDTEFAFTEKQKPSVGVISYTIDPAETVGNEAKAQYKDIIDYNIPYDPLASGLKEYNIPFAPIRFVGDGEKPTAFFEDPLFYVAVAPLAIIGVGAIFIAEAQKYKEQGRIQVQHEKVTVPKLYILKRNADLNNAQPYRISHPRGGGDYLYNSPMMISDGKRIVDNNKIDLNPEDNLYRFFAKEDPRNIDMRGQEFKVKFLYNCDILEKIINGLAQYNYNLTVNLPYCNSTVLGTIESIAIHNTYIEMEGVI